MKNYILNLVHRLYDFSESLSNKSLFVDKPWVLIDEQNNYHKYIFKNNGDLIMSMNGYAQIGKWDYVNAAKSILIDRIKDKILLNHAFFNQAIMVLKMDGINNPFFILANENEIPDLNVKNYLLSLTYEKYNVITGKLVDGRILEVYREKSNFILPGMYVTIDGEEVPFGKYQVESSGTFYKIENSMIDKIFYEVEYELSSGTKIMIEQQKIDSISIGDIVYDEYGNLFNGEIMLNLFTRLYIIEGVVRKKFFF